MRRYLTLIGLLVAAFTTAGVLAGSAAALESGDTVRFLIPADANQPDPPSGPQDKLIYTGGRVTTVTLTEANGCGATGTFAVQNAVLVDPAGGRSGRIIGVITTSQTDPVASGTSVGGIGVSEGTCTIGGVTYHRYSGTVE